MTSPMPQPEGATPQGQPQPSGGQEANPLQVALGKLLQVISQIAEQNPVVQAEMMEARSALIKGLQKTMLAAKPQGQPQPAPAPQAGQ